MALGNLLAVGDLDNRPLLAGGGLPGCLFGRNAGGLRRAALRTGARRLGLLRLVGGDGLIRRAGLMLPVAGSDRRYGGSESGEGRDDKNLLHGVAPAMGVAVYSTIRDNPEHSGAITKP